MAHFAADAYWAELSRLLAPGRAQNHHTTVKNEYTVLALEKETAVQAVVGCIV